MDSIAAIAAFSALAQPTRLEVFRFLIRHEPEGLAAGDIADELGVRQNTLSTHLGILLHARLVSSERQGRSIIYRARLEALQGLVAYLIKDCCGGNAEICAPLVATLTACATVSSPQGR